MNEATGQSGDLPSAQRIGQVLDYHDSEPIPLPWFVRIAGLIVFGIATLLVWVGSLMACNVDLLELFVARSWSMQGLLRIAGILFILVGAATLTIEYFAVCRRDIRCSLATAMLFGPLAIPPLGLHYALTIRQGLLRTPLIVVVIVTAMLIFCSAVHFVWAARLYRLPSGPQDV